LLLAAIAAGCSAGSDSTLVDGVEIGDEDMAALHVDVSELDDDERAASLLLLILREGFGASAANELDLPLSESDVDVAYEVHVDRFAGRGGIDTVLEALNQTPARVRVESELDVIRDTVSEALVRSESAGFDINGAYEGYLVVEAEVCIRQMQLESGTDFDVIVDRLDAGETFGDVAREMSIDPFVGREEGVGAGGDLGCSAPDALPGGLDTATLLAPLNEPTGPVIADTGMYLLEVYERTAPHLEDVRSDVIDFAVEQQGPDLFRTWAIGVLQTIDVEIAESYGAWGMLPETDPVPTVVPPYRTDDIVGQDS
jgi:parvulin-like peptidyl-prolyl isomerase